MSEYKEVSLSGEEKGNTVGIGEHCLAGPKPPLPSLLAGQPTNNSRIYE